MLFIDVNHKFMAEPTNCHGSHIGVRNLPFDSVKETHQFLLRKNIINIFVSEDKDSLLLFIDIVYFYEFR